MFEGNLSIIAQMALDMLLILAIVVFIVKDRAKRAISSKEGSEAFIRSLENFLKESKQLSQEFDRNLGEKRKSINGLVSQLDAKVKEINLFLSNLEAHLKDVKADLRKHGYNPDVNVKEEVLMLAKQSLTKDEIAQRVGRPKDEIELTLDLKKRSLC